MKHRCPLCAQINPSGTFATHPTEKPPFLPYRVQCVDVHLGDFETIELARAAVCGGAGLILEREKKLKP